MTIIEQIKENLMKGKAKDVKEQVEQAMKQGALASDVLNQGLLAGMSIIGEKFKKNEVYVPEVLIAARAMKAGMEVLKPALAAAKVQPRGVVVIGTVKGDLHDIGKNLVRMMMEGKGLEVIDLGVNVSAEQFIQAINDHNADIVALSALLTTTMNEMKAVVEALDAAGLRDKVKVMIGGAPVTESFCVSIGADAYATDAASASERAIALINKKVA